MSTVLTWDLYEISSPTEKLVGKMVRGRMRAYALEAEITLLVENSADRENAVVFALLHNQESARIESYIYSLFPDATIELLVKDLPNPVLSKAQVNIEERYFS